MIRLTAVIDVQGQARRALAHESSRRSLLIGRDKSCDFRIPLPTVSRHHVRIREVDGAYLIEDAGSTHGVIVNDVELKSGETRLLADRDVIDLPQVKIHFYLIVEANTEEQPAEKAHRAVHGILERLGEHHTDVAFLRILNGAHQGRRLELQPSLERWTIGRAKDCDAVLPDPNISRYHGLIRKDWSGYIIQDSGSRNGIALNDNPIKKPTRLRDRDKISMGPVQLLFVDPGAEVLQALEELPGFPGPDLEKDIEQSDVDDGFEPELSAMDVDSVEENALESLDIEDPMGAADDVGEFDEVQENSMDAASIESPYSDLDSSLLHNSSSSKIPIEWFAFIGGGLLVVFSLLVLYLVLT